MEGNAACPYGLKGASLERIKPGYWVCCSDGVGMCVPNLRHLQHLILLNIKHKGSFQKMLINHVSN